MIVTGGVVLWIGTTRSQGGELVFDSIGLDT